MTETLTDAEKWARIRDAWWLYCEEGAGAFDWDYESRDLMEELAGGWHRVPHPENTRSPKASS